MSSLLPLVNGRVENILFPVCVVPPLALRPAVPKLLKEQFSMSPVRKRASTAVHGTQSRHTRPPLLSPAGSRIWFQDAKPHHAAPAQPWSQVSVTSRTQTPLWDALASGSSPCVLLCFPTAGTSVVSLVPPFSVTGGLVRASQTVSLAHNNHQTWLCDSVCPASSQVQGHSGHYCAKPGDPRLVGGDRGPPAKDAIEPVHPADMELGFYSPYFIVPRKAVGYDKS